MLDLPALAHRMTLLVILIMSVSAIWLFTACDLGNQNARPTHAIKHLLKSQAPRLVPHEVLVKFKDGISRERIAAILKDTRTEILSELQRGRLYHVRILTIDRLNRRSPNSLHIKRSSMQNPIIDMKHRSSVIRIALCGVAPS